MYSNAYKINGGVFVWKDVIYLRNAKRRPVRSWPYDPEADLQGEIPYGWCSVCGMEVYGQEREVCALCERWRCDELDGITGTLPEMHAGDRSAKV